MNTAVQPVQVTDAQRQQLDRDGYFISNVICDADTLANVRSEFQRMWDEDIARAEQSGKAMDIEFARYRPFFSHLEKRSEICKAFCRHPNILELARQLVGPDVNCTWNQAIVKPPAKGRAFAWHQDGHYAANSEHSKGADLAEMLSGHWQATFWIAISRTTIANGTLWVVPGMHKQGLLPHIWSDEHREWQCQFDSTGKVAAELEPGQVLVFTNLVPHCSGPNVSDEVRMAYQIGYGKPGILKNDYQVPVMREGRPV